MIEINTLAWDKMQGLIPAIIQDAKTSDVLMLAYMNQQALLQTLETSYVTFYSRSKNRLWTKGETSGNKLKLITITKDCDNDCILIQAEPMGPVCHQGTATCFKEQSKTDWSFIQKLEDLIKERYEQPQEGSYTSSLFKDGIKRIAQKVGEEGVEVALAALGEETEELQNEAADLFYHLLVLLVAKNHNIHDIISVLRDRHSKI